MTHSIIILKIIKETIKKFCQGYCDRLEKHPNNFVANFMKARGIVRRLKRKRSTDYAISTKLFYNS